MLENINSSERGVSPVIGVILMVAITVILAAVIAAFVLDIGPSETNPTAAVEIDGNGTSDVSVTLQSIDNGDGIAVFPNDEDIPDSDDNDLDDVNIGSDTEFIATTGVTGNSVTVDGGEDFDDFEEGSYNFMVIVYDGEDPEDLAEDLDTDDSTEILGELEEDGSVSIVVEDEFEVEVED